MSTQTKPWEVVSYLTPAYGVTWHVRRDRFAGVDWLTKPNGQPRRFRSQRTAQIAADSANRKAAT